MNFVAGNRVCDDKQVSEKRKARVVNQTRELPQKTYLNKLLISYHKGADSANFFVEQEISVPTTAVVSDFIHATSNSYSMELMTPFEGDLYEA